MRNHYCPYCGKPTPNERFTTTYFLGIMKSTYRVRSYRKCMRCGEYYFTLTEDGTMHGKRVYLKIPKDEAVSWRFKKSIWYQKKMDRIPVTFGEPKTWLCTICRFPFHTMNPKKSRNQLALVSLKKHYKHTHPPPLDDRSMSLNIS